MDIREQIGTDLDGSLLAGLPIPVAIFDRTARLIACSPAYVIFSDLPSDFLATRPSWSDLIARLHAAHRLPEVANLPVWRDDERHRLASLLRRVEERHYLPDGTTFKRTASPLVGGGFMLAYEDMTPRLAAERAVNEAALVQRQTLDHLGDALAVFGADGRLKFANRAFTQLWAWPHEDRGTAPDNRLADFLLASASPWSPAHLLARGAGQDRIQRDNRVLDAHHLPLPDGAVLLRYVDVTLAAQLDDALRARIETTEAADRMKSHFVATLAHEARVPLTTIAGFAEMLAGGYAGPLAGRQQDYATAIAQNTHQLAHLIDDVLDLACIDAGLTQLDPVPFDLHAALASLIALVAERARSARLTLSFDCSPNIGRIEGDERRLRQAMLHLLNNALAYTPAGGTITLAAKRGRGGIDIAVTDTGIGIARDDLARIEHPFERGADAHGLAPGAGLGLALVERLVELHGGALRISSLRNRGTTAAIHLPLATAFSMEKPGADR